jgi:hypothetical protein
MQSADLAIAQESPRSLGGAKRLRLRQLQQWASRHKLNAFVELTLNHREIQLRVDEPAKAEAALLDGCYC